VSVRERRLRRLLKAVGVLCLPAIVGAFMPCSWLAWCVRRVETDTPMTVLVEYLARLLSLFYVLLGALLLAFARDVQRCRLAIRVVALWVFVADVAFLARAIPRFIAHETDMLFWLIAFDVLVGACLAAAILLLQRRTSA